MEVGRVSMSSITKIALADSLKKLLHVKTLDKITVKDIVEDCGVNRQTFYYHFHDIYDLLGWFFIKEAEKIVGNKKTYTTWHQGFLEAFKYVNNDKKLIINAYNSIGREYLENYLYSIVYGLLKDIVEEKAQGMNVSEEDKKFVADFYKYAFVGLSLEWIRMGMKDEPEYIIEKLSKLIKGDIEAGLKKLEKIN
ncbi:TetR/AcrR family transcriptional regulator [Sarcina ventriculi]